MPSEVRRVGLLLPVIALAAACERAEPAVKGTASRPIDVQMLGTEPGAIRLLLAPDDRWATLERDTTVGGAARAEIIDVRSGTVERTVPGRAVGAPNDDGSLVYVEFIHDRRWQVRTTADARRTTPIDVPDGSWRLETSLGAGDTRVLVFSGENERWIVSLGADLAVRASTSVTGRAPGRAGPTVALAPNGDRLFVLFERNGTFGVSSLSAATLAPTWTTTLEPPQRDQRAASGAGASGSQIRVQVAPWGDRPGFLMQPSGDGEYLLVVNGEVLHGAITEPPSLFVLDAGDGRITSSRRFRAEGPFIGHVRAAAPVPLTPQVVLLHVSRFREGGVETPTARFGGVTRFDLSTAADPDAYVVSPEALGAAAYASMKTVVPSAIAVTRVGTVLLAP